MDDISRLNKTSVVLYLSLIAYFDALSVGGIIGSCSVYYKFLELKRSLSYYLLAKFSREVKVISSSRTNDICILQTIDAIVITNHMLSQQLQCLKLGNFTSLIILMY